MNIQSSPSITSPDGKQFGFWGRLPLAQKLLLSFGTIFIFAVIIAVFTLSGLNRTSAAYKDTLTQGIEIRRLSDQVEINLLRARRDGKDFLLRWNTEGYDQAYENYVTPFNQDVITVREFIQQLAPFGPVVKTLSTGDYTQEQYETDIATLEKDVDTYEQSFFAMVAAIKARGSDENTGLEGEMRTSARNLETKFEDTVGLEQLEITLLQIRRNEKDYINRRDKTYIDNVHALVTQLKTQIAKTEQLDPAAKTELLTQADVYLKTFDKIVAVDQEIDTHYTELANAALALDASSAKINALGEQLAADDINRAEANNAQTFTISIIIIFIALASSILLSITLSRQITQPVTQLTNTAQQIAEGNFDAYAEVNSADEVGALAKDFNSMTSRLRQAFEDVRRRALAVQTSAEVSQRLSVATNPGQLAVDVVEQVQAAFNYYHAHIYFLDENSGDLIMAGGTGEAGAKMLANKHRVAKGRGLVGRAAATNEPVLVPDVSQAEGWLPNALLPDTQSEVAIPISSGKQVLGVLDVQQNLINGLDQEDVTLLQSLAGQVAISLQNARSFEQSRAQADMESLVNAIGQKVQRATTVEDTLQTAIRELGLALGATRVSANIQASSQQDGRKASHN